MNLIELRKQLVSITGRYDLMNEDFTNNGIDFYINSGQHMLDKLGIATDNHVSMAVEIASGDYSASFNSKCLSVFEVFVNDTIERTPLERVDYYAMKEYYANLVSTEEANRPEYYALASLRILEAASRDSLGAFLNLEFQVPSVDYRGLIFMPPADKDYVIEVSGKFYSLELSDNNQETYWTTYAPEILIKAAMYQLYKLTGRSRDADDIRSALNEEVADLDKMNVEEDVYITSEMGG